jgi:hypothetical protein
MTTAVDTPVSSSVVAASKWHCGQREIW